MVVVVSSLSLAAIFSPDQEAEAHDVARLSPVARAELSGEIYYDHVVIGNGEVHDGDVTVTAGNVLVEKGGMVEGALVVLSGNVAIQEGAVIEGDVTAWSGNVKIAGYVGGSIAAANGNVELAESAVVDGDVSVVSGKIVKASGAVVEGNIMRGPQLEMPWSAPAWGWGAFPGAFQAPNLPPEPGNHTFWGWLAGLVFRLMLAVLFTGVAVVLTTALFTTRPDLLRAPYVRMVERSAHSFVVGLVVNLLLLMITLGLFSTCLLIPVGMVPGVALLALNVVGWTLVSRYVGERLAVYIKTPLQPGASLALGALLLTGVIALLWALDACFRPVAYLFWLLSSAFGVGAALLHWFKLDGGAPLSSAQPDAKSPAAVNATAADAPIVPVAASDESRMAEPMIVASPPTAAEPAASVVEPAPPASLEPSKPPTSPVTDISASTETPLETEVDFTIIIGIGPVFDRRLKAAGVHNFAQLASLTPEQIAAIIGWTPQRVLTDDLIGQARKLAESAS
jgi:predicted flap endonuclease-1-like 5' DNA nuclease/cytoskeletal protein CcmA (bactofilin family)